MYYKTKEITVDAVKYDGTNYEAITAKWPSITFSNGSLHDENGCTITNDTYICKFSTGEFKMFKTSTFEMLFGITETPKYRLGDPELEGKVIRRTCMCETAKISWTGYCWLMEDDGEKTIYNPTLEDITVKDWIIV